MKYRKLRIAWSVGCGVICLLLITLWVRSYWRYNAIFVTRPNVVVQVRTLHGKLSVLIRPAINSDRESWLFDNRTALNSLEGSAHLWPGMGSLAPQYSVAGFAFYRSPKLGIVAAPYWVFVFLGGLAAALPWIRWHFSLRTLLIATTLFAVALGLIIALSR